MIIGSASELSALGESLKSATEGKLERTSEEWPLLLVNLQHKEDQKFQISFHLETETGRQPEAKSLRLWPVMLIILLLLILGVGICVKGILSLAY